jgi:hypothetical protein
MVIYKGEFFIKYLNTLYYNIVYGKKRIGIFVSGFWFSGLLNFIGTYIGSGEASSMNIIGLIIDIILIMIGSYYIIKKKDANIDKISNYNI